jgi:cobaltochelatase CobT
MRTRLNANFETVLEKLARILTRNYNINVEVRGNGAMTDGKTIFLPMIEDMSEEMAQDLISFTDHEVCHVKYTTFKEFVKVLNKYHQDLLNAVEDSRIELLLPLEYPGAKYNLRRLNEKWGKKIQENLSKFPWPIRLNIAIRNVYDGVEPVIDKQIKPIFDHIKPLAEKLPYCRNTKELREATEKIVHEINKKRKELAEELPDMEEEMGDQSSTGQTPVPLKTPKNKKKTRAKSNEEIMDPSTEMCAGGEDEDSDDEDSDGSSGDSESEDSDESENSDETGKKSKNSSKSGKNRKNEDGTKKEEKKDHSALGDTKSNDDTGKDEKTKVDNSKDELKENAKNKKEVNNKALPTKPKELPKWSETDVEKSMMEEGVNSKPPGTSEFDKHAHSSESYIGLKLNAEIEGQPQPDLKSGLYAGKTIKEAVSLPFTRKYDKVIDYSGKGNYSEYTREKHIVMPLISPIKLALERVLKVKENARLVSYRERGKLHARALSQLVVDKNFRLVFSEHKKTDTTNVAVQLLIDLSGSMSGQKIKLARQAALAIGESLHALNIAFEVTGFQTGSNYEIQSELSKMTKDDLKRFNRFGETLELRVFKSFDCTSLSGISEAHSGGANADGESLIWAAKRLMQRSEKRKIMLVFSDGQPAYGGADHQILAGDLKRVVGLLTKLGVETLGFGIQTSDVSIFYPKYVVVTDINKLPRIVMGEVAKLLGDGFK